MFRHIDLEKEAELQRRVREHQGREQRRRDMESQREAELREQERIARLPRGAIFTTEFWAERLKDGDRRKEIHRSVYETHLGQWDAITKQHRKLLLSHIRPFDSVLDVGCGYGRLLEMLPGWWKGDYLGIDLSPEFIQRAKEIHPNQAFEVRDFRHKFPLALHHGFDWGVLISIRQMVIENISQETWNQVEANLKTVARKLLVLEYIEDDKGEVIE